MAKQLLMTGLLLTLSSPVLAKGTISLTSTAYPDSVVITATINDTGGSPECGYIVLLRNGGQTFLFVERQIGSTITKRLVDTNVDPSTLYCYTMDLGYNPFVPGCGSFCEAFECFYQIETCVNTGPDPAFIGHGLLSEFFPGGGEVDHNETQALLYPCNGPPYILFGLHTIPGDAAPYLDSGDGVDVYGTWMCCWAQGVWLLVAQVVEPHSCVLAVEKTTWGRIKSLYRN
jgi:hypothetical protein